LIFADSPIGVGRRVARDFTFPRNPFGFYQGNAMSKKQVVCYARFSPRPKENGGESLECDSNEKQFERLRDLCRALDYEVVAEYQDEYLSGGSTVGRDGLEEAIQHAMRIRGVLACYDVSRLSRDVSDGHLIVRRLRKRGVELLILAERIDTTTPAGRLMFTFMLGMAQYYREENAARTSRAMKKHLANGRRMCRRDRLPFGWKATDNPSVIVKDENEQRVIERIVELSKDHSARAICRILDREGTTRRGGKWHGAHALVAKIIARASHAAR